VSKRKAPKLSGQILDEATTWFVEFGEGEQNQSAREEFIRWLRTSPEHVRAYLQITAHWEDARALKESQTRTIEELIALARAEGNVIALGSAPRPHLGRAAFAEIGVSSAGPSKPAVAALPSQPAVEVSSESVISVSTTGARRLAAYRPAIAAGILVVIAAGTLGWLALREPTYATGIGEQRTLTLAEGSTVELNARSKIRIAFHPHERDVELLEGQALFKVTKDRTRPFIVKSGDTQVRAVGTAFDVYRKTAATVVTVIEGRVAILPPPQASVESAGSVSPVVALPPVVLVSAGQQVTVTAQAMTAPRLADTAAATAWTQKQMVFASTPLSEVVAEFNRYNTRQLVISDPSIASTRISGVFSSTDPASLLRGLNANRFTVRETPDRVEIMGNP
jgi:transmembrane sensor